MKANVNDRASVEAIYSRDAFRTDCGHNSVGNAAVLHGVTILSEPDAEGAFDLAPAKRQTGENDPEGDTVFLPAMPQGDLGDGGSRDADYAAYIDRTLEAARSARFKSPVGQDSRLKGFHGG